MNIQNREFIPSARFKEIFGFNVEDTITYEDVLKQVLPEHQTLFSNAVESTITRGEKFDVEFSLLRFSNQNLRWVRGIGNLSHDDEGKLGYFTGLLHDITERKQDDIRKNDFIAMASHELKTPLTSIQAYLQVLTGKAKTAEDDFAFNALSKAGVQVKKMAGLINGFLNVSRFEAGKIHLNKQNFEINELVDEILGEMKLIVNDHQLASVPCKPITVYADRDKIGQVINNLLTNAVKYSAKGKNIEVRCLASDGRLQVSVKDEGVGIAQENKANLFDRFYRIESVQNHVVSGFGIGLYLCAEIIHRHDGVIWVESDPGEGSTFHFSVPLL